MALDKMTYDPNSRSQRRRAERERRKKRNIKIAVTFAVVIVALSAVVAFFKADFDLPKFDVKAGFLRLVASFDTKDEPVVNEEIEEPLEEIEEPMPSEEAEIVEPTMSPETETQNISTKKSYNFPSASENNDFMDIFKNMQGETEKICCLTFDDGPNKVTTPKILDILKEYGIKATFFEVGTNLELNGEVAKRTYEEGHLLLNHTYSQKYSVIYTSWESFFDEVKKTDELIKSITGEEPLKMVRMPGGSFNSGVYGAVKQEYKAKLKENGYYFVDWSVDNGDNSSRTPEEIVEYVKSYTGSKPVVLLMEDSTLRKATPESLKGVLDYLKEMGYTFKRLDEINYFEEGIVPEVLEEEEEELIYDPYLIFLDRGFIN